MATKAEAQKTRILDAFIGRLATKPVREIELTDIAADAGVTLSELRAAYSGRLQLLAAFNRRIDLEMLAKEDPEMAGEPGRDRLFDVVMGRLDALSPYREAVRMLAASVRRDPALALAMSGSVIRSMTFMLAAAGISTAGRMGMLRAQGLAIAFSRIVDTWLDDTDPGLARTMVAVDRELGRCASADRMISRVCRTACRFMPSRRRSEPPETVVAGEGI